jgi:hypothetical protein
METGFSTLATASATLLGLVLVAVVFAYRSTFTRLDRLSDFTDLARWIWTAGFSCFMYFGICLLVSFRMMELATDSVMLFVVLALFTGALLVSHVFETIYLHSMASSYPGRFRMLVVLEDLLAAFVLIFFEAYVWYAVTRHPVAVLELNLYSALTYTLFLAALRSVALVTFSFRAITILEVPPEVG